MKRVEKEKIGKVILLFENEYHTNKVYNNSDID